HGVEATLLTDRGEGGLEATERVDARAGTDRLVTGEDGDAAGVLDGDDGLVEVAVVPRGGSARVRLGGETVDLGAVDALEGGDEVGTDALGDEVGRERGGRVHRPGAAVAGHRHAGHR